VSYTLRPRPRLTLNTDGHRHPRENLLTGITAAAAVISLVCAFAPSLHLLGAWAGVVGVISGGVAQYLSATTAERMVIVPSLIGSAVGLAFGLHNGGLW
jgi:predicted MFS family arabinose efflux permease